MSAIPKPRTEPPAWKQVVDSQRLLLHEVSWDAYIAIGEALRDRPIRLTYDRGNLEIMTTPHEHEHYKIIFGYFVMALAEELEVPIKGFGSATYQKKDLERGLEPDECYYTTHWPQMRGVRRFDFTRDPPPDFVIEIDVTRSSIDRMGIYAKLGVPEIWVFNGTSLRAYVISSGREYREVDSSPTFPGIPLKELVRFARDADNTDDLTLLRAFRAWVKKLLKKPSRPKARRKKK